MCCYPNTTSVQHQVESSENHYTSVCTHITQLTSEFKKKQRNTTDLTLVVRHPYLTWHYLVRKLLYEEHLTSYQPLTVHSIWRDHGFEAQRGHDRSSPSLQIQMHFDNITKCFHLKLDRFFVRLHLFVSLSLPPLSLSYNHTISQLLHSWLVFFHCSDNAKTFTP